MALSLENDHVNAIRRIEQNFISKVLMRIGLSPYNFNTTEKTNLMNVLLPYICLIIFERNGFL